MIGVIERSVQIGVAMIQALLCRFGIHHDWHIEHAEDGGLYRRCLRCGKDESGGGASNGWALQKWW